MSDNSDVSQFSWTAQNSKPLLNQMKHREKTGDRFANLSPGKRWNFTEKAELKPVRAERC
jgi:hypothetical protein